MLHIQIAAAALHSARPANPAHLFSVQGLQTDIYVSVSRLAKAGLILVFATYVLLCVEVLWLARPRLSAGTPSMLASGVLAVIALVLVVSGRKIAAARIYFVPMGDTFPLVGDAVVPLRMAGWRGRLCRFLRGRPASAQFDFHFVVRETEPNVAARLKRYAAEARLSRWSRWTLKYDSLERGRERFMASELPTPDVTRAFARSQFEAVGQKRDLWPVARLIIGRILYQRPKTKTFKRNISEENAKPEVKGAHYYLAYKLNTVALSHWFMLLAYTLLFMNLDPVALSQKQVRAGILIMILLWTFYTIAFNRRLVDRWRSWLAEVGNRPLGKLPLFLYVPWNDQRHKWEELDESDFKAYLDEYLMDTSVAFQLIFGALAGMALTISGLLG